MFVPLLGRHTACNALAAIAVGAARWASTEDAIIESLAHADGPDMRLQLRKVNGVTLLNDAYNANPNSMRAALETLAVAAARRAGASRCSATCSSSGEHSERYHREIGELAAQQQASTCSSASGKKAQLDRRRRRRPRACDGRAIVRFPDAAAAARGVVRRVRERRPGPAQGIAAASAWKPSPRRSPTDGKQSARKARREEPQMSADARR